MIRRLTAKIFKRHLLTKLFISFLLMALLTVGLLWLIQAGLMRDMYLNRRIDAVHAAIDQAVDQVSREGITSLDTAAISEAINASVIWLDDAGSIKSTAARIPMMGQALRHMRDMADSQTFGVCEIFTSSDPSKRYALIGQPLEGSGTLFALFSLDDVDAAASILRSQLSLITFVLLAISTLIALILSQLLSRPILAATRAARQLAAGRIDTHLKVKGQDEIADLTRALNELGDQLQVTENLRRELIANVSHELRSPLTVISGYAETVRDVTWPDAAKRQDQLTMIADEAHRLTQVVNDILDYSKLKAEVKPPEIVSFSIQQALETACRRFELTAASRRVSLNLSAPDLPARFDPKRLDQVVINLLGNAINHADPDTQIHIRCEPSARKAGSLRISISNQGQTIAPEDLPKIWERFYRAGQVQDELRLGSGLGLAIVRSILEQHGVPFGVMSENHETTFWFETV